MAFISDRMKVGRTMRLKRYCCAPAKYIDVHYKAPAPVFALHTQDAKFPISNQKRTPEPKRPRITLKMSEASVT